MQSVSPQGLLINLHEIGVHTLRKLVDQATTAKILSECRLEGFEGVPLLEPAAKLVKELREKEDYQGAGLIRTWVAGGFWTQDRLFRHGAAPNPMCALCKHEEGTPSHRLYRCLYHAAERQDWCGAERKLLAQGRVEHGDNHPMTYITCKGLFPDPAYDPKYGFPPPHQHDRVVWFREPPNGGFEGLVCTDGSGKHAHHPLLALAGWAAVMIDDRGGALGAAYGPVRFPWTCSGAGELWAAIIALRHKGPSNIVIVTDYLELKKAWDRGDDSGAHVRNHIGELWREFWRLVHDVGREGIDVIWIPSAPTHHE